ncbi:MAG: T9SS type A sorting domain-containing protein [Bacteroidota bacterium]
MRALFLVLATLVASSSAAQTDQTPTMRIDPGYGADRGENFGRALSVDGDRMAVGAPGDYSEGARSGAVYLYERRDTVWVQTARLTAPSPQPSKRFGEDLVLDGNRLAITAPGESTTYLYTYDGGWALSETIRFRTGFQNGMDVALQGDRLVIGEPGIYPLRGRVYVLDHGPNGWSLSATLAPPDDSSAFGYYLDLDGNRLIVTIGRRAYVYEFQDPGWTLASTLAAYPNNLFDSYARLSSGRLLTVATPPSAYVFEWDGTAWERFSLPLAPVSNSNAHASSLDVDGNRVAIGVTYSGPRGDDYVALFEESDSGWAIVDTVAMERPDSYDRSWDTIVLEDNLLFGAAADGELDRWAENSGTVQIVTLDGSRSRTVFASGTLPTPEQMGRSISTDGSRLAVATLETTRIYRLTADEPVLEATLGEGGGSLDIDGTRLLIGNGDDNRAFFYSLGPDGWTQNARLGGGDRFGTSVALDGGLALIGSPTSGAAEVRTYALGGNGWQQTVALAPQEGAPHSDEFGTAVALDGGRALVGDPGASNAGGSTGAAYVFELASGTWEMAARVQPPDASQDNRFGSAVALNGGHALVSAPQSSGLTNTPGTVYALTGEHWRPSPLPTDGQIGPRFGTTLALAGNRAAVGGYIGTAPPSIPDRVITYAFNDGMWTQTEGLIPGDVPPASGFGTSIAISGRTVLVGAPLDDWIGPDAGTVYLYEGPFAIETAEEPLLASSILHPAAPNPFRERSRLALTLPSPEWVTVTIVDVRGRIVETLLPHQHRSGTVTLTVDGQRLAAGLYLVRAVGETFARTRRITILP